MSEKDISKIFALLYEIKKRITKLEKNMIEGKKDNQINSNENNNDFTRGSTLW